MCIPKLTLISIFYLVPYENRGDAIPDLDGIYLLQLKKLHTEENGYELDQHFQT